MSKTSNKSQRSHALIIIAGCFLASAVLRGGTVAEAAVGSLQAAAAKQETAAKPNAAASAADRAAGSPEQCDAGPMIEMLKSRESEFSEREAALNARSAKLDAVAKRLQERLAALEKSREALSETVAMVDGAQSRDIDHLVTMYSTMKPKTAGKLFDQMDVKFASELLVRTKPEVAALILANMSPDRAFTASVMIARRNAEAPNE